LKKRGITTEIDLIMGLPGDDPEGFKNTLGFIIDNNLGMIFSYSRSLYCQEQGSGAMRKAWDHL
jgi:coproporphyrinogen III oxidase-like Fe-S oxidoreductase